MSELPLLLLALSATSPIGTRVIPRFDGLLMELTSKESITASVTVMGYEVLIQTGSTVSLPEAFMPFWVLDWQLLEDSTGFIVDLTETIDSLSFSYSTDSLTMLLFFRAAEPLEFPSLSWSGPPDEPDHSIQIAADSVVMATLEMGEQSPWLSHFNRIVIDPGHGGRDPGAVGPEGSHESDRALEIALLVRDILNVMRPDLEVHLTLSTDSYVSLGSRTRMANSMEADLFVSIHCNAAVNSSAQGIETYFLSTARTDDARTVEMLENSAMEYDDPADAMLQDPLSFLLADTAQNIFQERSSALAVAIQESMTSTWPGNPDRGVKQAGFYVLRGALMPSVLVEVAFISNPEEEYLLRTLDYRLGTAEAIVNAILSFATE